MATLLALTTYLLPAGKDQGDNTYYEITQYAPPTFTISPVVSEHHLIFDRSGSMWGNPIDNLKMCAEQALAVESVTNGDVRTSLTSFSTQGDCTEHWTDVAASDVFKLDNPYLKALRSIQASSLTGMSQALFSALSRVTSGRTTAITLFTDGYANSPSAFAENRSLEDFVKKAKQIPGLFLNCIGYGDWCDWPRLQAMANDLSGKCVQARSFTDVLSAMKDTQAVLAYGVQPAIEIENTDPNQTWVVVNLTAGKINAIRGVGKLVVAGIGTGDDIRIFSALSTFKTKARLKTKVYNAKTHDAWIYPALILAMMGTNRLRVAKNLLMASGNKTLWAEHSTALTPSSIIELSAAVTTWLTSDRENYKWGKNMAPKFSIYQLDQAFRDCAGGSVSLNVDEFIKTYRRRSIQKIAGTRAEDGTITPNAVTARPLHETRTVINNLVFNESDASVQLHTVRRIELLKDGKVHRLVASVELDELRQYRDYTLISCGERNVEKLVVQVHSQASYRMLLPFAYGKKSGSYKPGMPLEFRLKDFSLDVPGPNNLGKNTWAEDELPTLPSIQTILTNARRAFEINAELKILNGMAKKHDDSVSTYSAEQKAALSEFHLTGSSRLYFSPPQTVHYADRNKAIEEGVIDSYTRYRVRFYSLGLTGISFRSGNEFVKRYCKVQNAAGEEVKVPTLMDAFTCTFEPAQIGPRMVKSPGDVIMEKYATKWLYDKGAKTGGPIAVSEAVKKLEGEIAEFQQTLRPLVMQIGCSGLLPAEYEEAAPDAALTGPEFSKRYPNVPLTPSQMEGMYYVIKPDGNEDALVVAILPETEWYTKKPVQSSHDEDQE